ncbi:MAG: hypothetical protein P4N59_15570 [Negativicutes bacterium]|nr:hypothetical protein [Negativicutes bacterium]
MAVLLKMADIPENIFIEFLKSGVLAGNETFKIVPLGRWLRFFYSIPNPGFVVTDKRVIIHVDGFSGLNKQQEFSLQELTEHSFAPSGQGHLFRFLLQDGSEYTVLLGLPAQDCQLIDDELSKLLTEVQNSK